MKSAEGEIVDYMKSINVEEGDRKGNVEKWMLDVEAQMMGALKDLAKQALAAYPNIARTQWSKMWPGQIVLAVS
jgi:dynein heavy chain